VIAGNGLMRLAAAMPLRRCPVITMVYGLDIIAPHRLYQAICLPLIARSAAVIACSSNSARMAREHGVPAERLHAITPGVDLPAPAEPSPEIVPNSAPLLVSVGRLIPRKGIAEFVRHALPIVLQRFPSARFLVIGEDPAAALKRDGSESARIRHAAQEAGVESHVELTGFLDDAALARTLEKARVHVFPVLDLPGDVEGFGMVALEAAAHGLPTVAFDAGGVRDAVADGFSGVLVTAGDYTGFAANVCKLLSTDQALRDSCREYARAHSWSRYVRRVEELVEPAVGPESNQRRTR
jgi:phosphatidylinositol alpha-1,6-mannosyltransferase